MPRCTYLLAAVLFTGSLTPAPAQDKASGSAAKPPDGVYAVLRDAAKEADVLPLKEGETLVIDRHPYAKKEDKEPPRYLVIHKAPDVEFDLAAAPKPVKEGDEVARILLQLQPKAAKALERLTADRTGGKITIVLGGDVVMTNKVQSAIKGGEVQISTCDPGSGAYLLKRLEDHWQKK